MLRTLAVSQLAGAHSASPSRPPFVDDEPPIRKLLRMGLSSQGYSVLEAPNGKTALEFLNQGPDLIVLDLGLLHEIGDSAAVIVEASCAKPWRFRLQSRGRIAARVRGGC